MSSPEAFYASAKLERFEIDDATIAVRRFGSGPALVLIHGFPVHGYTWRALLPRLAERHTCFVLDLPGLGDSGWSDATDFSFTGQARRLSPLLRELGIERLSRFRSTRNSRAFPARARCSTCCCNNPGSCARAWASASSTRTGSSSTIPHDSRRISIRCWRRRGP
jgi:hypothetical protein